MQQQALTEEVELCRGSYPVYCIESGKKRSHKTEKDDWQSLIERFIEYQQGINRTESTLNRHRTSLKHWTDYLDGLSACGNAQAGRKVENLAAVTSQVAAGYPAWLYQAKSRFGKPFALKSQIIILNSVQVFFKYLLKTGQILRNPVEVIQLPREPKKLPGTILTSREMKRLLAQPDTETVLGFRDRTIYEVLYSTGLRISELIGMRVQDLNLSEKTLFIPESKNFKDRYAPLGATACRYLSEYLNRVRPLLHRASANSVVDVLFLSRLGRGLHKTSVFKKLKIYGQRAAIEKNLTVHVFRHTLATEMLRRGADLRQIQELLGHRNLKTTQIYTHIVKGELRRIQAHCHPREQVDLPDGFTAYRGRDYLTEEERGSEKRGHRAPHPVNRVVDPEQRRRVDPVK